MQIQWYVFWEWLFAFSWVSLKVKNALSLETVCHRLGIWVNFPVRKIIEEKIGAPETHRKYLHLHWALVRSQSACVYSQIPQQVHALWCTSGLCCSNGRAPECAASVAVCGWGPGSSAPWCGALHHSASWLDRPWLWGPSRSCWELSNRALLRQGSCILLMDYSPTSPVWVDFFDRRHTLTCRHGVMHVQSKLSEDFHHQSSITLSVGPF